MEEAEEKLARSNGPTYALVSKNVTAAMRSPSGAPWEWRWEPHSCALPPFRPARWCAAGRHTLLVGDSLMFQTYQSWAAQLGYQGS